MSGRRLVPILAVVLSGLLLGQVSADAPMGITAVVVPDKSILTPPAHAPVVAWREGTKLVIDVPGLERSAVEGVGSLAPFVGTGHTVLWRRAFYTDLQVGDIAVFYGKGCGEYKAELIAHQVIEIDDTPGKWSAQTMWTSTRQLDPCRLTPERVAGYVVGTWYAGFVSP